MQNNPDNETIVSTDLEGRLRRMAAEPWFTGGTVEKLCNDAANHIAAMSQPPADIGEMVDRLEGFAQIVENAEGRAIEIGKGHSLAADLRALLTYIDTK